MEAVAHSAKFAKKVGVPQSVGKDFSEADKGKKFRLGGTTNPTVTEINKQKTHHGKVQLPNVNLNKYQGYSSGGLTKKEKEMKVKQTTKGMPALARNVGVRKAMETPTGMEMGSMGMKKGGMTMKKMAKGGETMGPRNMSKDVVKGSNKHAKFGESMAQTKGKTRGKNLGDTGPKESIETEKNMKSFMKKYAKGGTVYGETMGAVKTNTKAKHGDGIAERGHTRAMMPKMAGTTTGMKKGGMTKKYC